jgi:tetrahydrodipicolinate N-succinyltransferase
MKPEKTIFITPGPLADDLRGAVVVTIEEAIESGKPIIIGEAHGRRKTIYKKIVEQAVFASIGQGGPGSMCFQNHYCRIGANAVVYPALISPSASVGDHCWVGVGVSIGPGAVIEENVLIGPGSIIGPGLTIGAGSIVAQGANVTCNVSPGNLVIGNPARLARRLINGA